MKITSAFLRNEGSQKYVLLNNELYGRNYIRELWHKGIIYHPLVYSDNLDKNLGREDFRINLYKIDKIEVCNYNGWLEPVGYLNAEEVRRTEIDKIYIKL